MSFSTNMTAEQWEHAHREQLRRDLRMAEAYRNTYQAEVDRLRGLLGMEPERRP